MKWGAGKQCARAENAIMGVNARAQALRSTTTPGSLLAQLQAQPMAESKKAGQWERTQRAGRFRRCGLMGHVNEASKFEEA